MAENPAARCGGCAAPLPWAALGRRILMFETAETRDLCARCTLDYYFRTGGLGAGRSTTSTAGHATFPFSFAADAAPPTEKAAARKAGRCAACRKKVGLLGFACRCGGTFCPAHRHAESHSCGFDYRAFGRDRIAGENPLVAAPKVAKISSEREGQLD